MASGADEKKKIPPVADRLVYYAQESGAPLFVDQNGEAHVLVRGEALPIAQINRWLTELIHHHEDRAPSNDGLVGAKRVLDMLAHRGGDVRELHTRAAFHEGAVFYQLGKGRVVRIDERGWEPDPNPPVTFRSIKNLRELPDPVPGGSLSGITDLVNLKTGRDRRLFLTHIALTPLAHVPRPILQATGVMGSGKSTACRVVKRMMDPTNTESVTMDRRDFLQKASHCYLLMLDNQNSLPEWALDTLCRLVTGESDSKRVLYTDEDDLVWSMKRGVLLNGINAPSERGDVQDRVLPIELDRIGKLERLAEDDFWLQFSLKHPEMLGAAFDALSGALRERHTVRLDERPRLADWGLYAAALYEAQGWGVGQFVDDWRGVEEAQQQGTLDGSVVAQAIVLYMADLVGQSRVEMASSKLHSALEDHAEEDLNLKKDRAWPKTGRTLWKRIREVMPLLEAHGIRASRGTSNKAGRPIILEKIIVGGAGPGPGLGGDTQKGDDKGDDNRPGDDKGDDNFSLSSPETPHGNGKGDDNGLGGRYFGVTISSDRKEESRQGESKPDLSSPSYPQRRMLTEEEAREVQKLISEGMSAKLARAEVIGENPPEPSGDEVPSRTVILEDGIEALEIEECGASEEVEYEWVEDPPANLEGEEASPAGTVINIGTEKIKTEENLPAGTVYVGREVRDRKTRRVRFRESIWHNPFIEGKHGTRQEVLDKYEAYVLGRTDLVAKLPELRGKVLACWCVPKACHAAVLLRLAEESTGQAIQA